MDAVITIDEAVYREASEAAEHEGVPLKEFVEDALWLKLGNVHKEREHAEQSDPDRLVFLEELEQLFEQADKRDRSKAGEAGPFPREELYAERLDRFR